MLYYKSRNNPKLNYVVFLDTQILAKIEKKISIKNTHMNFYGSVIFVEGEESEVPEWCFF